MSTKYKSCFIVCVCVYLSACASHFGGVNLDVAETAKYFLVDEKTEDTGYGLYSYLIFSCPPLSPDTELAKKYVAAIKTYLTYQPVSSALSYKTKDELNIFYLMLAESPSKQIKKCLKESCAYPKEDDIHWIIKNYNYSRARSILNNVPQGHGPYIITFRKPIGSGTGGFAEQVLIQDLTEVPLNLIKPWMRCFLRDATGQGASLDRSLKKLRLILLKELTNISEPLPVMLEAIVALKDII